MTELLRIHRDAKGTSRWLEPVCERIRAMSARFDGNPEALVDDVWKQYAAKAPTLGLFVAIEDDQIVGHLLAFVRDWDGRWVGWIAQVEHDRVADRATVDGVIATLTDWIEQWNFSFATKGFRVDEMIFCTPHMHDAWARHSGFTDYRSIKIRKIPASRPS